MNSLVSADYGSSSSDEYQSDDEDNVIETITTNSNVKNLLRSASDSEADASNDSYSDENHSDNLDDIK